MELTEFVEKFAAQFEDSDIPNISSDTDFKLLDTWDSLTAFSIQMMIEDEFNAKIAPEDFRKVITVEELFQFIQTKLN